MSPARCPLRSPLALRLAVLALLLVPAAAAREIVVRPGDDLAAILESCRGPAVIRLKPGEHRVSATPYADARCANCENPATPCSATRGLLVTGRGVRIEGAGAERTVLRAEAGYGVLFEASEESALVDNVVVASGQDSRYDSGEPYCPQEALALVAVPDGMRVQGNVLASNREAAGAPGRRDVPCENLCRAAARTLDVLSRGSATRESAFVAEIARCGAGTARCAPPAP